MDNSSHTPAVRPLLPQPPLSIAHLILLTAGVGVAVQINGYRWNGWSWTTVLQAAEIGFQGFVLGVTALGMIRLARQWMNPKAPRYPTLPGHMLAYLWIVLLGVRLATDWAIPWLENSSWTGKMLDARREIAFMFVIQLLELPAIAWFRHKVKGSVNWHFVALALLILNLVSLLELGLSASYHVTGNRWTLAASAGLANPISYIIQWSLVAASILFSLLYERFTRGAKVDWLHTASAGIIFTWACVYLSVHLIEVLGP